MIASYKEKIKIKKYTETNIAEQLNASLFVILYIRNYFYHLPWDYYSGTGVESKEANSDL
jgi:hypothetical protein